jgi:hypothetical protein
MRHLGFSIKERGTSRATPRHTKADCSNGPTRAGEPGTPGHDRARIQPQYDKEAKPVAAYAGATADVKVSRAATARHADASSMMYDAGISDALVHGEEEPTTCANGCDASP